MGQRASIMRVANNVSAGIKPENLVSSLGVNHVSTDSCVTEYASPVPAALTIAFNVGEVNIQVD